MKWSLCLALLFVVGCDDSAPAGPMFYERTIQPILTQNCVFNQGACHKDDGHGNALGNLDLTSYANLIRRKDVLRTFGSFPVPLLLLKASGGDVPQIPYKGNSDGTTHFYSSEIQHVGGATIAVTSAAFTTLQKWLANGANEDGSVTMRPQQTGTGPCNPDFATVRPDVAAQLATVDTSTQAYKDFTSNVEPVLAKSCTFSTCHSGEQSDFFLTCKGSGSDDADKFNFLEAQAYVGTPPETSEILLKPLAPSGGGIAHTGGTFFQSKMDPTWIQLSTWAAEVGAAQSMVMLSDSQQFFEDFIMPVFLKRGCALEACHSPGSANDFKLRSGSQGFISRFSLQENYDVARNQFLVADVPDVRQSRLVKKPVVSALEGGFGLVHRGGPPLQTAGESLDPTVCPQPFPTDGSGSPFCAFVEWHRRERAALVTAGTVDTMASGSTLPLVSVVRPPTDDRNIDFDTYRPGADLVMGTIGVGALGAIDPTKVTAGASLLGNCAGVLGDRSNVDVRHPAVSYDAGKLAFAMRLSASDTLDIYEVTLDAAHVCTKVTDGNGMQQNGILRHNLDPVYASDGTLVFASTRGGAAGPTRSLKYLLPQTDLWRMTPINGVYGAPAQMTALLGSELSPAMMLNGQMTFTAEKASADFYQLSGRRINWDLTDYHPLLAQRAQSQGYDPDTQNLSMHPSVGYEQATEIREGLDRNFVLVLSDVGAKGGGGTLATFNRSVGPFEADRTDIQFLHSLEILDPGATGRVGPTQGAYRSPFPLPDGRYLASYDGSVADLSMQTPRYDLVIVNPVDGTHQTLAPFAGGSQSHVEAVVVYKREPRPLFHNETQLVFGGHVDATDPTHGTVHYPDLPMLATLLGANLRTGRFVDMLRAATQLVVYQDQPPPSDTAAAMAGQTGSQMVYQNRMELGRVPLASDGSVQVRLPSLTPVILELQTASGGKVFTMTEEDQLGPGEHISRGVPQKFFNSVCAGCHGSVSGVELDIALDQDALTSASVSLSRDASKTQSIGP
jgi:hypothetical protein